MSNTETAATLPAPCRVQIGKTVYNATAKPWDAPNAPGPYFWDLVAIKGPKTPKSLFPDFSDNYAGRFMTLYSAANGRSGCGLPKLVEAKFFTGPQS